LCELIKLREPEKNFEIKCQVVEKGQKKGLYLLQINENHLVAEHALDLKIGKEYEKGQSTSDNQDCVQVKERQICPFVVLV
jgi:hypothetical protein